MCVYAHARTRAEVKGQFTGVGFPAIWVPETELKAVKFGSKLLYPLNHLWPQTLSSKILIRYNVEAQLMLKAESPAAPFIPIEFPYIAIKKTYFSGITGNILFDNVFPSKVHIFDKVLFNLSGNKTLLVY